MPLTATAGKEPEHPGAPCSLLRTLLAEPEPLPGGGLPPGRSNISRRSSAAKGGQAWGAGPGRVSLKRLQEHTADAPLRLMPQPPLPPSPPATPPSLLQLGVRVHVSYCGEVVAGVIGFLGETDFAPGQWVGVSLDEPLTNHDGLILGRRYFLAAPLHGLFVRRSAVAAVERPRSTEHGSTHQEPPPALESPVRSKRPAKSPSSALTRAGLC